MKKIGDLKIGTRLSAVFVFIVILVASGYIYSIIHTIQIKNEIDKIYNIHLLSIDYLIESDRDAYQSSIAISHALSSQINSSNDKLNNAIGAIIENHNQVKERFTYFENIAYIVKMEQNKELYEVFQGNYVKLDSLVNIIVDNLKNRNFKKVNDIYFGEYMGYFDTMRDALDQYTGLTLDESEMSYNQSMTISKNIKNNSIILTALIILLIVGSTILLTRSINRPLTFLVDYINKITSGNLTEKVPKKMSSKKDEIGIVLLSMTKMVDKLIEMVNKIKENSQNINTQSEQLSASSQQLSQGSNEQAASSEEISSSMEQMVSNINQNTENAQETEKKATQLSDNANDGYKAVKVTLDAMKTITEKISIIGEIAEKTDLLAINAAIEAARAGEHGKGFAVVAAEVRKLAERSQVAATQINDLSVNSMKDAENAGDLLENVVLEIKATAQLVQEISAASIEQNSGASQINSAVQQFASVTQQNSASSEEMAASAEELESQANNLNELIDFFKIEEEIDQNNKKSVKNKKENKEDKEENDDDKDDESKDAKNVKKKKDVKKEISYNNTVDPNDQEFEQY